jgi:putative ABC transport system permease protein
MRNWTAYVRAHLKLPSLTPEREAHIVRELAAQLEDFYREALARGASDAEADAFARAQVGDWDRMARDVAAADRRHARPHGERIAESALHLRQPQRGVLLMLAHVLTDIRYAFRQMAKAPGFTIVAVLTLAFGIGASSSVFTIVNAAMLQPLPYPGQDRLAMVFEIVPRFGRFAVAPANFLDWRAQSTSFEGIAAFGTGYETLVGADGAERLSRAVVSWNFFDVLGLSPALGRGFRADEDLPQQNGVVVLSHGMWQRRFGGDPQILGRSVILSGVPSTVVGVMPPDFDFPNRTVEFWRPLALNPANAPRGSHYLTTIARLKNGVSFEQASAEMAGIAARLAQQYPANNRDEGIEIVRLRDRIVGSAGPMLYTLLAAVGIVVLIACANVANLLLVRASVREKEIAIRAAMGAGRRRIVGQMLSEGIVLAVAGGLLGVLLAYLAITPLRTLGEGSIPRATEIALDWRVLAFAVLVTVVTGILFSLAPAWHAARTGLGAVFKDGSRSSVGARSLRVRNTLLVVEVALSIVLLVGATLLLRSFARITAVDPGFRPEQVLTFSVGLPQVTYPEDQHRLAFFGRLHERLRGVPGVRAVGMVQTIPIRSDYLLSFTIQGKPSEPGKDRAANYRAVTPGYFEALTIPLMRGRLFTDQDVAPRMVAVIDETFAKQYFPGEDPIGRGIGMGNGTDGFYEIVGVVGSVKYEGLDTIPRPTMYAPFSTDLFGTMWMMVKTAGDPRDFAPIARQVVRELDPTIPAASLERLDVVITESVAQRRFSMLLLAAFALVALFLAAVGLYGVVAYAVSLRTQEIGLRMAIGAQRSDVLRMVLGGGMKLAAAGVVLGLLAALWLARFVATMLFGVTPFDPVSYSVTAAILLSVSALACYVPARRATTVDPLVALRTK